MYYCIQQGSIFGTVHSKLQIRTALDAVGEAATVTQRRFGFFFSASL